jgi:murein DD-endopeptidase MepM/ murein hydrolase activator NlpD
LGNHRADRRGLRRDTEPTPQRVDLALPSHAAPGRRKASKHTGSRGSLIKGLPSVPVLMGLAALSVSAGGAVTMSDADVAPQANHRLVAANALSGNSGQSSSDALEGRSTVSRDSRRDALADAADADLVAEAEAMTKQRNIALNLWQLPLSPSITTAEFGDYGLWASYHTGLDFNGVEGQEIMSVARGTVTSVGYDGSYGNKTVVTLEDGTEIWYCHQSSFGVSEGEEVDAGEVIGYVGSTGNVTGSHLHLEVRPGGGDPVDPYAAFLVHGVTP